MRGRRTEKEMWERAGKKTAGKLAGVLLGAALLAGCQAAPSPEDTYISVEDAKAAALENAGLSADQVRFVRFGLETGEGDARYEIEFISEDAGYDYGVDAVTGEILSMSCEIGSYNLADMDTGMAQEGSAGKEAGLSGNGDTATDGEPSGTGQPSGEQTEGGQGTAGSATADPAGSGSSGEEGQYIGRNKAQQIALEHAKLAEEDVRFLHARLEFDDGIWLYDVEFHKDQVEYDYEIDAVTGKILEFDQDAEYDRDASAADGATGQMLTEEEAVELALKHAQVDRKDAQSLKVELDYDDGRSEYEVKWDVGRMEYSCDVDAYSGQILSFKKKSD